jgi:membrane protease YdiL (CAAX protease family)
MREVAPGVAFIIVVDLLGVSGLVADLECIMPGVNLSLVLLPWVSLFVFRKSPRTFGYHAGRGAAWYGWGMVAGGVWRGLSMVVNFLLLGSDARLGFSTFSLVTSLLIVPFAEETFYRGYLGRAFSARVGFWPGVIIQSALFSLYPVHWVQGWPALVSIFGFGILAGWIVERTQSIWSAWGAHGFANVLPLLLLRLAGAP